MLLYVKVVSCTCYVFKLLSQQSQFFLYSTKNINGCHCVFQTADFLWVPTTPDMFSVLIFSSFVILK